MNAVDFYLFDLKSKFTKINHEYYLSYSRRKRQSLSLLVYKRICTYR